MTAVSLVKLTRDKEFWLEDGNIILIACDVGFRIYRGLLAAQSTVFADMFSCPNSTADEYYDDCPVVRLSDSPEDLRYFLRVLVPSAHRMYVLSHTDGIPPLPKTPQVLQERRRAASHLRRNLGSRPPLAQIQRRRCGTASPLHPLALLH